MRYCIHVANHVHVFTLESNVSVGECRVVTHTDTQTHTQTQVVDITASLSYSHRHDVTSGGRWDNPAVAHRK